MDSSASDDPVSSDSEAIKDEPKKKKIKFTPVQISRLQAMYACGTQGTGQMHLSSIQRAARDTGLEIAQVKRWIKKKNYKKQHQKKSQRGSINIPAKQKKRTPWQMYLKQFGDLEAGKKAMQNGPGAFNKAASESYKKLNEEMKAKLQEASATYCSSTAGETMSIAEVRREGRKIFSKIQCLFKQLERMKYRCLAFGFFQDDVQVVTTEDCAGCPSEECIEYIHALTIYENPPCPPTHHLSSPSPSPMQRSHRPSHKCRRSPSSDTSSSSTCVEPSSNTSTSPTQKTHQPPHSCKDRQSHSSYKSHQSPSSNISSSLTHKKHQLPSSHTLPSPTRKRCQPPPFRKNDRSPPSTSSPSPTHKSHQPALSNTSASTTHKNCQLPPSYESCRSPLSKTSSPKRNKDVWIDSLKLSIQDRAILEVPGKWLNDKIICAAHMLLKSISGDEVGGFQDTQLGKNLAFSPVSPYNKFIQILHVDGNHWILVSNIRSLDGGVCSNSVCIYDSLKTSISLDTKKQICSLVKPKEAQFIFDVLNVQHQTNLSYCGLFAIAFATELVYQQSPVFCDFNTSVMRSHLLTCFESGVMRRFPLRKIRHCAVGKTVCRSITEPIYCTCRMPNNKKLSMIQCNNCKKWLHHFCEGIANKDVEDKWVCSQCSQFNTNLM